MISRAAYAFLVGWAGTALAQDISVPPNTRAGTQHYDLNMYPTLSGSSGIYDLNVASAQNGPPGTIAVTSSAPPPAYSFQDVLKNTHGYVSSGVSTGNGHFFTGAVSIPIVPGKAELAVGASTGQLPAFKINGSSGKPPALTYDAYTVGLALHPLEDVSAYIGVSGLKLHSSGLGGTPFGSPGPNAFAAP